LGLKTFEISVILRFFFYLSTLVLGLKSVDFITTILLILFLSNSSWGLMKFITKFNLSSMTNFAGRWNDFTKLIDFYFSRSVLMFNWGFFFLEFKQNLLWIKWRSHPNKVQIVSFSESHTNKCLKFKHIYYMNSK